MMRKTLLVALFSLCACGGSSTKTQVQSLVCQDGETPVYSNRFAPVPGGSGVASGADAADGKINSDGTSGGGFAAGEGDAKPSTPSAPPSTGAPTPSAG